MVIKKDKAVKSSENQWCSEIMAWCSVPQQSRGTSKTVSRIQYKINVQLYPPRSDPESPSRVCSLKHAQRFVCVNETHHFGGDHHADFCRVLASSWWGFTIQRCQVCATKTVISRAPNMQAGHMQCYPSGFNTFKRIT